MPAGSSAMRARWLSGNVRRAPPRRRQTRTESGVTTVANCRQTNAEGLRPNLVATDSAALALGEAA